jgi:hypothetical protein
VKAQVNATGPKVATTPRERFGGDVEPGVGSAIDRPVFAAGAPNTRATTTR